MPEPPMTPSTALVMRMRSRARIFRGRTRLELFRMQFHGVPDLLLSEIEKQGQHDQENEHLHADALPRLEVRLGGPHQEGRDVLGVLLDRHRRAVAIFDAVVAERWRLRAGVGGCICIVTVTWVCGYTREW